MRMAQFLAKNGDLDDLKAQWKAKNLTLEDLNAPDERGDTALLYAVFNNRPAVWEWLIEKGADIRCSNLKGDTVLHHIAGRFTSGDDPLGDLNRLIDLGADVNAINARGETPVLREALRGDVSQDPKRPREAHMKALAVAGADLTVVAEDGRNLADHIGAVAGEWISDQRVARVAQGPSLPAAGKVTRMRARP